MEYYLFDINGYYVGMRGSLPNEEENLTAIEQNSESLQKMANYLNPKLISGEIIESATSEEENAQKTFKYTKRITDAFTHLRRRALASSINKPLSLGWDYITEQADQYRYKYKVAIGQIQDAVVNQMIDDEAQDFGITPTQMRALIVQMFEIGDVKYTAFTAMFERGRTKALTAVENIDWVKAEILTVMLESVPEQLTMEQAEQLTTSLLNV